MAPISFTAALPEFHLYCFKAGRGGGIASVRVRHRPSCASSSRAAGLTGEGASRTLMATLASLQWQFNLRHNRLSGGSNRAVLPRSVGLQSRASILQSSTRKCFWLDFPSSVSFLSVVAKVGEEPALEITHPSPYLAGSVT